MHVSSVRASRAGARWLLAIGLGFLPARVGAEPAAPGWASKTKGLEVRSVSSLRFNAKGDTWYASVQGLGVCRSLDQGTTWLACGAGIETAGVRDRHLISL